MCGILGGFWSKKPSNINELTAEALKSMAHRGPDDNGSIFFDLQSGTLNLSHVRLSIIDLSEAGHQPMVSNNKRFTVVYNGEIYNYKELKIELEKLGEVFTTDSDTEVLLAAWNQWGEKSVSKFIGMFAFVIYDTQKDEITIVRDAFGIKPLYYNYVEGEGRFLFSSEIPSLIKLRNEACSLNVQRAYDYLVHEVQDSIQGSLIKGIQTLEPAHLITLNLKSGRITNKRKWWNPSIREKKNITFEEATAQLRELFLKNIQLHMRSDVPVGAALSGGVDSSAIVCAMRYLYPELPLHTFSFIADGPFTEEHWVNVINNKTNAIAHKVSLSGNDFRNEIFELIKLQGEPFVSTSIFAQFKVFNEARKNGITVVLEGQGADELLAGYSGYPGQRLRSLLERFNWIKMFQFASKWQNSILGKNKSPWKALIGQLLPEALRSKFLKYSNDGDAGVFMDMENLLKEGVQLKAMAHQNENSGWGRRVMEILLNSLTGFQLPSLLRYGDRNAMHFSIENRVPYLTTELAEFCLSLPEEYLVSENATTKHIFKQAMRGIVPDEILDRKDKIGFITPMTDWLTQMADELRQIINESNFLFINKEKVLNKFNSTIESGSEIKPQLWRVLNFLIWAKLFDVKQ